VRRSRSRPDAEPIDRSAAGAACAGGPPRQARGGRGEEELRVGPVEQIEQRRPLARVEVVEAAPSSADALDDRRLEPGRGR
jgi:hypothetical protein